MSNLSVEVGKNTDIKESVREIEKETKLSSSKWIFLMCWLVYAAAYIARGNFSFGRSLMMDEGLVDAGIAGIISAVYFICYVVDGIMI